MRMSPVEGGQISLPAGETVSLQPGGLHVMCIGLTEPFTVGETIPLTLVFAGTEEMRVEAEIRAEAP
jgi:copper(I)-binding protein